MKSVSPERAGVTPPAEASTEAGDRSDCWVRLLRHVVPAPKKHFEEVASVMGLNQSQTKALCLTRKHCLVLTRGPPGTGKTQLAAAAVHTWATTVPTDSTIIAGPSNAATNNLLDRIAVNKGKLELGRLGDDQSIFAESRGEFSLTLQASRRGNFGTVSKHVLNGRARKLTNEGKHHALFSTYMKSAELGSCNTYFLLADEAGQATEPTANSGNSHVQRGAGQPRPHGWRRASAASNGERQECGLGRPQHFAHGEAQQNPRGN